MDFVEPKIDVHVAHEPNGRLGVDYNRVVDECQWEWLLIIDHDVILSTNPNWYHLCQAAIRQYPDTALFTCFCNNMANRTVHVPDGAPMDSHDFVEHHTFAKTVWDKHGYGVTLLTDTTKPPGGFFMLINKQKAKNVGKFRALAQFDEDCYFMWRIWEAGYDIRRIDGLYVYHVRARSDGLGGTFVDTDPTAWEIRKTQPPLSKKEVTRLAPTIGIQRD